MRLPTERLLSLTQFSLLLQDDGTLMSPSASTMGCGAAGGLYCKGRHRVFFPSFPIWARRTLTSLHPMPKASVSACTSDRAHLMSDSTRSRSRCICSLSSHRQQKSRTVSMIIGIGVGTAGAPGCLLHGCCVDKQQCTRSETLRQH